MTSDDYTPTLVALKRAWLYEQISTGTPAEAQMLAEQFDRAIAGVRADQAEVDAKIALGETHKDSINYPGRWAAAKDIRRAVALTPTTEETEQ